MQLKLLFKNLKPQSTNSLHRSTGKIRYKTQKAVEFEKRIACENMRNRMVMNRFENQVDIDKHYLEAEYYFFIPKSQLYTKKKYISARSMDLDNCLKALQDGIFKGFNKLNDALICSIETHKLPSPDSCYHIAAGYAVREHEILRQVSSIKWEGCSGDTAEPSEDHYGHKTSQAKEEKDWWARLQARSVWES